MLEFNASWFLDVLQRIHALNVIVKTHSIDKLGEYLDQTVRTKIVGDVEEFIELVAQVDCKSALVAAQRLQKKLKEDKNTLKIQQFKDAIHDIESRFRDHLQFIKLFIVPDGKVMLLGGAETLLGQPTAGRFPSAWFDCEEAAKCLCHGRPTASVFHSMRLLEIAIQALAKRLSIPDPVKAAERNWGVMLGQINKKIEELYPKGKRLPKTEGAFLEDIYASLDAVKNPWRNATMHVESIYTEEEARHILACTAALLKKMAGDFDENGQQIQNALLPLG